MAPLVPDIISNEFDLVIALIVGFGFGFVLEQAGFSNARKLVGLFYGYDFVVLKVFFTAGITAMIGVLFLGHFGLLDLSLIYINPTFLKSAIIGGLIMGLGFVVGGFCPGTSLCAAAIGKVDAMVFIIGSFAGIYLFMEIYPFIEGLYLADAMGDLTMPDFLSITPVLFATALTAVALIAFLAVSYIESKVNRKPFSIPRKMITRFSLAALIPFILIATTGFVPDKNERIRMFLNNPENLRTCNVQKIDVDKFAFELVNNHYKYNVIDIRSPEAYKRFHLPLAVNIPLDSMFNREWLPYFKQDFRKNIYYSDDTLQAKRACKTAQLIGKRTGFVLDTSPEEFGRQFFTPEMPPENSPKDALSLYYFRKDSGKKLLDLDKALGRFNSKPQPKKARMVQGGCS
jgi:rhodanese-related sulfurtransferase/uncharacterized membrane protein YedE/YeeE